MMPRLDLYQDNLISEHISLSYTLLKIIQHLFETSWYGICLCTYTCLCQGSGANKPALSSDNGNIKYTYMYMYTCIFVCLYVWHIL